MEKGAMQAAVFSTLAALAFGVWMVMSQLVTESATRVLRNPKTGQRVACHAAFTPASQNGHHASSVVALCPRSCMERGFSG